MMTLLPGQAGLEMLESIYRTAQPFALSDTARAPVEAAAASLQRVATGEAPIYGVNTGFGKLASVRIASDEVAQLQRNLILSHCCGVGESLPAPVVRLMIALKLLSLGRGASGVRWEVIEQLQALVARDVLPRVPAQGSVGASGDLAPLAHLAAVLMGEGEAYYQGRRMPAAQALREAGLTPIELVAKEGLALINGTQTSTALALAGLFDSWRYALTSLLTGALSTDAAMGSSAPFIDDIHQLRGHREQIEAAGVLRRLMQGSVLRESHRHNDERVQDPYCLRCQPQVLGACLSLQRQVAHSLQIEANAVTDNPLVLADGRVVSGGNFHAEPVAFAADQLALAIAEAGAIAQRRIAMLVDPAMSFGLPAFLTPAPGLNSGFMIAEVTSAALMSENKQLATPASVDSTPTSANQEDHVSMACHGARRLLRMNDNLAQLIGIEALIATQGVELRAPLTTSAPLQALMQCLRERVPSLQQDRYMANDLASAAELVRSGELLDAVGSRVVLPSL